MTDQHESYYDQVNADPRGHAELTLAHFADRLEELFHAAFAARPDVTAADLADAMGVPSERVESLLSGDSDLRTEAFVRYTALLGYVPSIELHPTDERAVDLALPAPPAPGSIREHYNRVLLSEAGTYWAPLTVSYAVLNESAAAQVEYVNYEHSHDGTTGQVFKGNPRVYNPSRVVKLESSDEFVEA
jgi:plasmid maintenance system antidote protein VapI